MRESPRSDLGPVVEEHHLAGGTSAVGGRRKRCPLSRMLPALCARAPRLRRPPATTTGAPLDHGSQRGLDCFGGRSQTGLKREAPSHGKAESSAAPLPRDAHEPLAAPFTTHGATAGTRAPALEILDRDHLVGKHLELLVRSWRPERKLVARAVGGQDHGLRTGVVSCTICMMIPPFRPRYCGRNATVVCMGVVAPPRQRHANVSHRNIRSWLKRNRLESRTIPIPLDQLLRRPRFDIVSQRRQINAARCLRTALADAGGAWYSDSTHMVRPKILPLASSELESLKAMHAASATRCLGEWTATPASSIASRSPSRGSATWLITASRGNGSQPPPLKAHAPHEPGYPPRTPRTIL